MNLQAQPTPDDSPADDSPPHLPPGIDPRLQDALRNHKTLLTSLPANAAVIDRTGTIVAVNDQWLTFGKHNGAHHPGDCVGANYLEVCEHSTAEGVRDARVVASGLRRLLAGEIDSFEYDYPCHSPTSERWFMLLSRPLIVDGECVGAKVLHLDVTARHMAEQALRESEDRYRDHFENGITEAVIIHANGRILNANLAFRRIFPTAAGGVDIRTFLTPPSQIDEILTQLATRDRISNVVMLAVNADGERRELLSSWTATRDRKGVCTSVTGYFIDHTERTNLERQLVHAQKLESVGRLAGGVAHDFNNVLTLVLGYSAILTSQLADQPEALARVKAIEEAGQRAAALTRQLLVFSRKEISIPEPFDICLSLKSMQRMLRLLIGEDIELSVDVQVASMEVIADRQEFEQVIMNLAINARDAMPIGGSLTITARLAQPQDFSAMDPPDGPMCHIAVVDSGFGMTPDVLSHIFEPFFTTKSADRGTGLGLATSYSIIGKFNGRLTVESEVGKGSTFVINLPVTNRTVESEPVVPSDATGPSGSESILLVEDEPMLRLLAYEVLSDCGYDVVVAKDGKAGLELLQAHPGDFQMIVTDIVMPQLSGVEMVRQAGPLNIPVLYMSGYDDRQELRELSLSQTVQLLRKPFAPAELSNMVRDILDGI